MSSSDPDDALLDELRRANPVDPDALPSPHDPGPAHTLESILADTAEAPAADQALASVRRLRPSARRRWLTAAAAAVVIALAAATTVVILDTGTGRDATAAVHEAVHYTLSMSDVTTTATTVTFDFDVFDDPWELRIEAIFSDGDFEYRLTPGPPVPQLDIEDLAPFAQVVVGGQSYRSQGDGPWEGPFPYIAAPGDRGSSSSLQSLLSFGAALDDLGEVFDFVDMGDEELHGVATSHFRTHATPDGAGAGFLMTLGMMITVTGQAPPSELDSIQFDVWVDGGGLIRRVSYAADIDGIGSFRVVTDWDNFGDVPPITVPVN